MKRQPSLIIIVCVAILLIMIGCNNHNDTKPELKGISIIRIGKCQYVRWHRAGYGADLEHYGACDYCISKDTNKK